MAFVPRSNNLNYEAWMGLPIGLQNAWDAFNKTKQAKAQAINDAMELQLKRQKLASGGAGANDIFDMEAKLRNELFSKAGGYDTYQKLLNNARAAKFAYSNKDDVALLYTYIRALDPNSVVREGEVALAQTSIPWLNDMVRRWTNAVRGAKTAGSDVEGAVARASAAIVSPMVRNQMFNTIADQFKTGTEQYRKQEESILNSARGYAGFGVQPERIWGNPELTHAPKSIDEMMMPVQNGPAQGMTQEEKDRKRLKELEAKAAGRY
jgi:hypothetical protein